jgi:predicted membrane-bound mannosyltransferase
MQNAEKKAWRRDAGIIFTSSSFLQHFVFVLIAILALTVRLPQLGERPMHTDESINAYIIGQLLAGESFQYDPQDRHGSVLAALT